MSDFVALDDPALWRRWRQGAPRGPLPTVGELQQLQEQARAEARVEGLAEGRARGAADAARFKGLAASLAESAAVLESEVSGQVLDLALDIARQMLQSALRVKPELLLPVVREAMRSMPASQPARILLNPADVELVRAHFGEELRVSGWQIAEDHRVQPGGCQIASPQSEVDATLATRWKRVLAALGRDQSWLDG